MASLHARPVARTGTRRSTLLLALASGLLTTGCGLELGTEPPVVITLEPVETVVAAYHPLELRLPSEATVPGEPVPGVVGTDTVWLEPSGDSLLVGVLLDMGDGERSLRVRLAPREIGEATFRTVAAPVVADPERALDSLSVAMEVVVSTLSADSSAAGHGDAAKLLAGEFERLVASMPAQEKRELAALLASYPADLAALDMESFAGIRTQAHHGDRGVLVQTSASTSDVEKYLRAGVTGFFDVLDEIEIEANALAKSSGVGAWWDGVVAQAARHLGSLAELARFKKIKEQWDQVEFFPFKPGPGYNDLWFDLTGETAGSPSVYGLAAVSAEPITFQNSVPVSLSVFHRYETLQLGDLGAAGGDTRQLLDLIAQVEAWWSDTRRLLEQVARDLGYDRSFSILDLPNPRLEDTYRVPGSAFSLGAPTDADVSCTASGEVALVVECSTSRIGEQAFTVTATYSSDFGAHELEIDGVATGCWDRSTLTGEWIRRSYTDSTRTEVYAETDVTFEVGSFGEGSWHIDYWNWGSWTYDCATNRIGVRYGTWDIPSLYFRPDPAAPDSIPRDGDGTSVWGDRTMDLIRK